MQQKDFSAILPHILPLFSEKNIFQLFKTKILCYNIKAVRMIARRLDGM